MSITFIIDEQHIRNNRWYEITEAIEDLRDDVDFDQVAHDEWMEREEARFQAIEQHMKNRTAIDIY